MSTNFPNDFIENQHLSTGLQITQKTIVEPSRLQIAAMVLPNVILNSGLDIFNPSNSAKCCVLALHIADQLILISNEAK